MAIYTRNEILTEIGRQVIESDPDLQHLNYIRIGYQTSDGAKKAGEKVVYADCTKISDKQAAFTGVDFIITFYLENLRGMSEEGLRRIMFHELLHVGVDVDGKRTIVPHDVEDFRECIDRWGTDWAEDCRTGDPKGSVLGQLSFEEVGE